MSFRLYLGGLPIDATYNDLTNWVWSTSGIMPVTRQLVRKGVKGATLQAGFVGFTSKESMENALALLRQNPYFGSYRVTVGISRDSKGSGKGSAVAAPGQQGQAVPPAPGGQGQAVPPAPGGQGQAGPPAPGGQGQAGPPASGQQDPAVPQPSAPQLAAPQVVESGVQTTEALLVDKDMQTIETMCVDQEVQTELSYPPECPPEDFDENHTLAPCSPTEMANSPTRSSPTHSASDAPTCLVVSTRGNEEEARAELKKELKQAKQDLDDLQQIKEELKEEQGD